jgi:hypothetical protein
VVSPAGVAVEIANDFGLEDLKILGELFAGRDDRQNIDQFIEGLF